MAPEREQPSGTQIDDDAVKLYFEGAGGTVAPAAMSMMTHEYNLPSQAVGYRLSKEIGTIEPWLQAVGRSAQVLDVGCGAGAWVELFANRFRSVVGVERSPQMVEAAQKLVAHLPNAQVYQGDGRQDLPDGPFEFIFLGGLMMYLGDTDVVEMLESLKSRLSDGGTIILRESTVRSGVLALKGDYQVVYRSVDVYRKLFDEAGIDAVEVRGNAGYTSMVIAENMVEFRRRLLPFLPKQSLLLGSLTWTALRAVAPVSFWALPQAFSRLNIHWPKLQNHFFRLRP
jgi:protein-L-isoaspartate O-methyltransferase